MSSRKVAPSACASRRHDRSQNGRGVEHDRLDKTFRPGSGHLMNGWGLASTTRRRGSSSQRDPLMPMTGAPYSYVDGNPLNGTDPLGLFSVRNFRQGPLARPTSIVYPGTTGTVLRTYDDAGRLRTVKDWANRTTTFSYDLDGFMTREGYPTTGTVDSFTPDG